MFKAQKKYILRGLIPMFFTLMILLSSVTNIHAAPTRFSPGDYVTFGHYWQDSEQVADPIVWRVLATEGSELFVVSDKILFFAAFDEVASNYSLQQSGSEEGYGGEYSSDWQDSTIRAYLNGIDTSSHPHVGKDSTQHSFKADAFTAEEWNIIKETTLADEETKDKLFLLSISEVNGFFPEFSDRWVQMTAFSKKQHPPVEAYNYDAYIRGYGSWITRSDHNPHLVSAIEANGDNLGSAAVQEASGIRPALKLNLDETNASALVQKTSPPNPVPIIEEITILPGFRYVSFGDTFANNYVELDEPPVASKIINGNTMLPFRYLCETVLHGRVEYEAETQKITAWVKGHELVMHVNQPVMMVDGVTIELNQAPIVESGHTLVPIRAFEPVVTSVTWLPEIEQVRIIP